MQNAKLPKRSITTDGAIRLRDAVLKQIAKELGDLSSDRIPRCRTARMLKLRQLDWLFAGMPIDGPEFLERIIEKRRRREARAVIRRVKLQNNAKLLEESNT